VRYFPSQSLAERRAMSFQIELDKYEESYGHFMLKIRNAIQETFAQEAERRGLTQADIAAELEVNASVVSRRLSGAGNVTLRTVSDLYTAMGREPLSNFKSFSSESLCENNYISDRIRNTIKVIIVLNQASVIDSVGNSVNSQAYNTSGVIDQSETITSFYPLPQTSEGYHFRYDNAVIRQNHQDNVYQGVVDNSELCDG